MSTPAETLVNGSCDEPFAAVRRAFAENFASRDELGAAVCVYHDGRKVVDLWGGHKDPQRTQPWDEDTIVCMMSVGKGVAAICSHVLIDRGELDIAKPVGHYWPEFVQAGKQDEFLGLLAKHWPIMRKLGLAAETEPVTWRGDEEGGGALFAEFFTWADETASERAHELPEVMAIWEPMGALCESRGGCPPMEFPGVERIQVAWAE